MQPWTHSIVTTSLGQVLVADIGGRVRVVWLGDTVEALESALEARFASAPLAQRVEPTALHAQVLARIEDPRHAGPLPLAVWGTPFQRRVWEALGAIPSGTTRTYAGVAAGLGIPRAVRAVAGACAANDVAVLIPCHRVVRADGGMAGYRWGVPRKAALLAREAAHAEAQARLASARSSGGSRTPVNCSN